MWEVVWYPINAMMGVLGGAVTLVAALALTVWLVYCALWIRKALRAKNTEKWLLRHWKGGVARAFLGAAIVVLIATAQTSGPRVVLREDAQTLQRARDNAEQAANQPMVPTPYKPPSNAEERQRELDTETDTRTLPK